MDAYNTQAARAVQRYLYDDNSAENIKVYWTLGSGVHSEWSLERAALSGSSLSDYRRLVGNLGKHPYSTSRVRYVNEDGHVIYEY